MSYFSETDKAREIIDPAYLKGKVLDIGSGGHPVTENAITVDGREVGRVDVLTNDLYMLWAHPTLHGKRFDCIYSSHTLEHLQNMYSAITNWEILLEPNGVLILYLPDGRKYNHYDNPEHLSPTEYESFLLWFKRSFCGEGRDFKGNSTYKHFDLLESGEDFREDCYSFYIIARTTKK